MSLLEIKDLVLCYGKTEALKGVSLSVDKSGFIALIGANGAGKSSILKVVSGLVKPTTGEVWYRGEKIDGIPAYNIVKMGISCAPEGRRLFSKLTVLENLRTGSRNPKRAQKILDEIFIHFPILKKRLKQKAGTLSGGEQQMLTMARAMMSEPELLLMDEPTLGLDPLMTKEIGKILKRINEMGTTVILAEQNARMALTLSQRGYVLEVGRIVIEGETDELVKNDEVKRAYLSA